MGLDNPYLEKTPWGWPIDPKGFRYVCNEMYDRYQKPLFVVENGYGSHDEILEDGSIHDPERVDYLNKHLIQLHEAIEDGCEVLGYTWWGPIDIVSAGTGEMKKKIRLHLCGQKQRWFRYAGKKKKEQLLLVPKDYRIQRGSIVRFPKIKGYNP